MSSAKGERLPGLLEIEGVLPSPGAVLLSPSRGKNTCWDRAPNCPQNDTPNASLALRALSLIWALDGYEGSGKRGAWTREVEPWLLDGS